MWWLVVAALVGGFTIGYTMGYSRGFARGKFGALQVFTRAIKRRRGVLPLSVTEPPKDPDA